MNLKDLIKKSFYEKAKQIGLSVCEVEVSEEDGIHTLTTSAIIGGVVCRHGIRAGTNSAAENYERFAALAATREKEYWDRMEKECNEDISLSKGGKPTMNPAFRITRSGHYTSGPWAA